MAQLWVRWVASSSAEPWAERILALVFGLGSGASVIQIYGQVLSQVVVWELCAKMGLRYSSDVSIIDRLDLIPEEFDVEKSDNDELNVPTE